jgi:nitrile hydratase accessory protein
MADAFARERARTPGWLDGELIFAAPWEREIFGVTMAAYEAGLFSWEEFRARLIAAIASAERSDPGHFQYWACWLEAFEGLLLAKDVCDGPELRARLASLTVHDHDDHVAHESDGS